MPELSNWQEEADSIIIYHIAVDNGSKRIVVISNDTDSSSDTFQNLSAKILTSSGSSMAQESTGTKYHYTPFTTH